MFIKEIKIKNFKCLRDNTVKFCVPDGKTYGSGLNVFVGENNSGKSSLMEAVYFVRNKTKKTIKRVGVGEGEESSVEQVFVGADIPQVIDNFAQGNKKKTFQDCVYEVSGEQTFRVKRSFETEEEAKKILFYNPKDASFSNTAGIDAPFSKFFQISNIWADTNPEDESRYGATTVCGNLLSDISEKFKIDHAQQYKDFLEMFHHTFNSDGAGLQSDLNKVAEETEEVLNSQFGHAKLRFRFDNPEPDVLFKNIKIFVNDGEETEISEKGHGLQRAVILSLLQVYARRITELKKEDGEITLKPHFLFIDEPELGLHPQAQRKLFDALCSLATTHQIFISTHSENFVSPRIIENIYKFSKTSGGVNVYALGEDKELNLKENRNFFLHHHRLFFAKNAVFVEGADDYSRYPLFCQLEGHSELVKDFQLLGSCSNFPIFQTFCKAFGIKAYFILDVDLLSKTNTANRNFPNDVLSKINALGKEVTHKTPDALLKVNLSDAEQKQKMEMVTDLRKENIFVLAEGAIEHYLNLDGAIVDGDTDKKNELLDIFRIIQSNNNTRT